MTCSKAAASSTLLDMGPMWSKVHASGKHPYLATKPWVGFKPTSPQAADGIRIEPAASVPSVEKDISDATAAPEPPEDPPRSLSRSHGLWTGPELGLLSALTHAYSARLRLP